MCASVAKTLEIYEREQMTEHVKEVGAYLTEKLDALVQESDRVLERRGTGLIQGIRLNGPVGDVIQEALKEGLLIISARSDVIRMVPPLVIENRHIDEMIRILQKVL